MARERLPQAVRHDRRTGGQLKIEPAALRATVDRFNGFCAKNVDEDFHRGERAYDKWLGDAYHPKNASLGAIERGPFYAVEVLPGDVGTYGGVVTDADARVLRADGSIIEGLYATGISTASVFGQSLCRGRGSIGPSFVWGYVAAKHAVCPQGKSGASVLLADAFDVAGQQFLVVRLKHQRRVRHALDGGA